MYESLQGLRGRGVKPHIIWERGLSPLKVWGVLTTLDHYERGEIKREFTEEERKIKEVADMVALSYDQQYRYLSMLRREPEDIADEVFFFVDGREVFSVSPTLVVSIGEALVFMDEFEDYYLNENGDP